MAEFAKRWEQLMYVPKSLLTPSLSGKKRLDNSYLRYLFIAQVIEYLAHKSIFHNENSVGGRIISQAVATTSWMLGNMTIQQLDLMLQEMTVGLKLLDASDLGTYDTIGIKSVDENGEYVLGKVKSHCGFAYSLSERGWESYRKQEYQILIVQLQSSRIGRFVSYSAIILSVIAIIITLCK